MADHLSRLSYSPIDEHPLNESLPDDQLLKVDSQFPWFADFVNYLATCVLHPEYTGHSKAKFLHDVKNYYWDEPYLF